MKSIFLLITCIALVGCRKNFDKDNVLTFQIKTDKAAYKTNLSSEQRKAVLFLLARTNELDRLFRAGDRAAFNVTMASINEEAAAIQPPLPQVDVAAKLFENALKAYRDAAQQRAGAQDALLQATIRKELTRRIIRGTLTEQEKQALQRIAAADEPR